MKKTIAIIVAAIFVFAMAAVSLAAEEKAEMAKPAENTPAVTPKPSASEMEKLEEPRELNEQKNFQFKELTPEEKEELLREFEEQEEKREFRNIAPEDIKWGEQEKPAE